MRYRPIVDLARLVAAALIVVFHAPHSPRKDLTISGLAYFLLLTFCLQGMAETAGRPFPIARRAARLLVPWATWSTFYGGIRLLSRTPPTVKPPSGLALWLIGPSIHLWYLPFAFLGGLVAHAILVALARLPGAWPIVALGAASLAGGEALDRLAEGAVEPWAQWLYAGPLAFLGLAVGLAQRRADRLAWSYLFVPVVAGVLTWRTGEPSYLIGVAMLSASIPWRSREIAPLRWAAGLTLGIYLIHPFFTLVAYKFGLATSWGRVVVFDLIASTLTAAAIGMVPILRRLAFGEVGRPAPGPDDRAAAGTAGVAPVGRPSDDGPSW